MAAADPIADGIARLSAAVAEQVDSVWAAVEAGELAADTAADLVVTLTELGNSQAQALALESYTAERAAVLGELPDFPARPDHALDTDRLRQAVDTIRGGVPEELVMRLTRLAAAEAAEAFTRMTGALLRRDPRTVGWTRGMNTDACELCTWWWRGDKLWHPDHVMPTHKGCQCRQVPAWSTTAEDADYIQRRGEQIRAADERTAARNARRADIAKQVEQTRKARK